MSSAKKHIISLYSKIYFNVDAKVSTIITIIVLYVLFLAIYFAYRYIIIDTFQGNSLPAVNVSSRSFLSETMLQGLSRDCIMLFILSFPPVAISVLSFLFNSLSKLLSLVRVYYIVAFDVVVLLCAVNVPYYAEFCKPFDINSFTFASSGNNGSIIKMIIDDSFYFNCLLVCSVIISAGSIFIYKLPELVKLFVRRIENKLNLSFVSILFIIVIWILTISFRPFQINRAEYSTDYSMDKIALNPCLYFASSILNKGNNSFAQAGAYISVLTDEELSQSVKELAQEGLFLPEDWKSLNHVESGVTSTNGMSLPNVVLIIMEGVSANLMKSFGYSGESITPFLDSLYMQSLHFPNCYSVGQRTQLGLSGILNSYPSLLSHGNLFNYSQACRFKGLAYQLHKIGYYNTFFIPHKGSFDGMKSYMETHEYDKVYSLEDYPDSMATITWGICDDKLFEYVVPKISEQVAKHEPSFTAMITISNHDPYELPQYFAPKSDLIKFQAVEYADWSIRKFFDMARKTKWFDNTLFVLLSDHGRVQQEKECELSEQMHHIPLMIYGKNIEPHECSSMTSQMDMMAVVLGILGQSYECNNFSQNVLQQERPFVCYSAYDYLVCRSHDRLYLYRYDTGEDVFYRIENRKYIRAEADVVFLLMKKYCLAFYQTADNITLPFKLTEGWM